MKRSGILLAGLRTAAAAFLGTAWVPGTASEEQPLAHSRSEFSFLVRAAMEVAAPLFGAEAERGWGGPAWNPSFLHPRPASDVRGAVFVVGNGSAKSTWVATAQDFAGGHVQYVNLIDGAVATLIDIRLSRSSAQETAVKVVYERTALSAEWNARVRELAEKDSASGPEWASAIRNYLEASRPSATTP
jgi:hypothetical protein